MHFGIFILFPKLFTYSRIYAEFFLNLLAFYFFVCVLSCSVLSSWPPYGSQRNENILKRATTECCCVHFVILMTLDLVGCPQAINSPICPLDVADSLSTQQVLSGLTFSH